MTLEQALQQLDELEKKRAGYQYAMGIVYFDGLTVAPTAATAPRGDCLALLSEESYRVFINEPVGELLAFLSERAGDLDPAPRRRVEVLSEEYHKEKSIPIQEYIDFVLLRNESESVWQGAKADNDFARFQPYLERIVETLRRFAGYWDSSSDPYEVWLKDFEKGLTRDTCEQYFKAIKTHLVPLIHAIGDRPPISGADLTGPFPIDRQRQLSAWLMEMMGIAPDRSLLAESEHPFTNGLSYLDVRLTTHYYENNLLSAIYSTMHEGGHALYELGVDPQHANTCISSPRSTAVHESQSRFFENYIGRSRPFMELLAPKLRELFPETFSTLDADTLYPAVNRVAPSLIRIEADELTYSLHILVRYEIEKMLFDGKIKVAELPVVWKDCYRDYLGVEVPDDSRGVLQDVHWSEGLMGYFPSYSLGSAYAAQILDGLKKDLSFDELIGKGSLEPIVGWLGDRFYRDAGLPLADEILVRCSGQSFDPAFYVSYLTDKYSKLFGI